jgi:plasmid maintenance system antidote protein VapI
MKNAHATGTKNPFAMNRINPFVSSEVERRATRTALGKRVSTTLDTSGETWVNTQTTLDANGCVGKAV